MDATPLSPTPPYAGFWLRVWASVIDSVLLALVILPVVRAIYGPAYWDSEALVQGPADFLLTFVLPAVIIVWFWKAKEATPGKMAIRARIVDAATGGKASTKQLWIRYLGYYVSSIPLGLGLLWVAWDRRKQGWHDKMAGTVVVRGKAPEAAA